MRTLILLALVSVLYGCSDTADWQYNTAAAMAIMGAGLQNAYSQPAYVIPAPHVYHCTGYTYVTCF